MSSVFSNSIATDHPWPAANSARCAASSILSSTGDSSRSTSLARYPREQCKPSPSRARYPSANQLQALWQASEGLLPRLRDITRFLVLAPLRRGEAEPPRLRSRPCPQASSTPPGHGRTGRSSSCRSITAPMSSCAPHRNPLRAQCEGLRRQCHLEPHPRQTPPTFRRPGFASTNVNALLQANAASTRSARSKMSMPCSRIRLQPREAGSQLTAASAQHQQDPRGLGRPRQPRRGVRHLATRPQSRAERSRPRPTHQPRKPGAQGVYDDENVNQAID